MCMDVKPVDVDEDVRKQFTNEREFAVREHMLQWIRTEASKLGFNIVIGRSDKGYDRRYTFVTLRCKRSGKYANHIRKLKRNDTDSRRYECPFKLCGYLMVNTTWRFNVIFGRHNHDMCYKLVDHPIARRLKPEEKEIVFVMLLKMVQPKNILRTLKRNRPQNVSYIKQVYIVCGRKNKEIRGPRTKIQQLLKLLEDNHYISR
ncbi:uncharacterized protein LOC131657971 [Vicia villosa]|uniref:uncharacterized protein LOC131657971 n=1 Tax=Vicia villosa TaxID=3911 RepID=UPI00273AAF31|nr:uncharacterized protein LOC131657971 [Vicia villosa]